MTQKIWILKENNIPKNKNELVDILLNNRGIEDSNKFINIDNPSKHIKSNSNLKELQEAIDQSKSIILDTIKNNYPIVIHGDYDADGQTATAILWRAIHNDLNYKNVIPYIPNRFEDGYGLSSKSLKKITTLLEDSDQKIENSLLITVDCGIVSVDEVKEAKSHGLKVIITDHHQKSDKLPDADSIIWSDKLTGAGIAWFLAYSLQENDEKYLDLAAIGTICDLQPLTETNRSIAKYGLEVINKDPNLGINLLAQNSGVSGQIDTYHIGWVIGPRLNATGRLDSAMDSLRLLSTDSYTQAKDLASELSNINTTRQNKTQIDLSFAMKELETQYEDELPKILVTKSDKYHEGIIGLVAGKMVQEYYRPSIAISLNGDIAKGSARSIEGISIIEILRRFDDLFENLGGHDMAAGFSIKSENIDLLIKKLELLDEWDEEIFTPKINIDLELPSELIDLDTFIEINKLKPFGTGNPEPVFLTKSLNIFNKSTFGKENNHTKLFLTDDNGNKITGLKFSHVLNDINQNDTVDIVYSLTLNEWNGNKNIEMRIIDINHT